MGSRGIRFAQSIARNAKAQRWWRQGAVTERSVSYIYADRMLKELNAIEIRSFTLA